jgi:hypothetical protein
MGKGGLEIAVEGVLDVLFIQTTLVDFSTRRGSHGGDGKSWRPQSDGRRLFHPALVKVGRYGAVWTQHTLGKLGLPLFALKPI